MKLRNCTKSGKANEKIFSEIAWNNFRIWRYFPNKGGSFSEVIRSIRIIPNFFPRSFGVFGQFRIFFRAHSEYSDNSELISELYAEIIWKFIKILCFFTKIFFFSFGKKSPNTPNSIFRANIRNLLLRVDASDFHFVHEPRTFNFYFIY